MPISYAATVNMNDRGSTQLNPQDISKKNELERLREENKLLKALLVKHGIPWKDVVTGLNSPPVPEGAINTFSTEQKIQIFTNLFRGRTDVYPSRWTSKNGKSGYSPVCLNEWKQGGCNKPKIKCSDCNNRNFSPLNEKVIFNHLAGIKTIGVYPLLPDDTCYFLAVDFDKGDWEDDALSFLTSCKEFAIPASLEISRSGKGAHVWIFFADKVPAKEARQLGASLISHTCNRSRQLSLTSYDRLFPNQDIMPKGGLGNLIALPLQKEPRQKGFSVFVDLDMKPYLDQWEYLGSIEKLASSQLDALLLIINEGRSPLDVSFIDEDNEHMPWQRSLPTNPKIAGELPTKLNIVVANQLFISKKELPQSLSNRLIRLAAFSNPEFYKAQALRLPVWDKPRIIGCAENFPSHISLPTGCLDSVLVLLLENNIEVELQDKRISGKKIRAKFVGILRSDQKTAVQSILKYEYLISVELQPLMRHELSRS